MLLPPYTGQYNRNIRPYIKQKTNRPINLRRDAEDIVHSCRETAGLTPARNKRPLLFSQSSCMVLWRCQRLKWIDPPIQVLHVSTRFTVSGLNPCKQKQNYKLVCTLKSRHIRFEEWINERNKNVWQPPRIIQSRMKHLDYHMWRVGRDLEAGGRGIQNIP